jgi:pimeloyl-ACP methyl ester carboxylesterase
MQANQATRRPTIHHRHASLGLKSTPVAFSSSRRMLCWSSRAGSAGSGQSDPRRAETYCASALRSVTAAAWHAKPSWHAVTDEDRMISPALQRQIAKRINAIVFILHAGHLPFLSKPRETADAILAAVAFVRSTCKAAESIAEPHGRA